MSTEVLSEGVGKGCW